MVQHFSRSQNQEDERRCLLSRDSGEINYYTDNAQDHIVESCESGDEHSDGQVGTTWTKASFLIVNAALGAGLLNFPAAFQEAGGLASGNITHLIFVVLALGSLGILAKCASERHCKTYQEVVRSFCGPRWSVVCSLVISLYCFVTCITFIIIIGDQSDRAFASYVGQDFCQYWYLHRNFTMSVSCMFLIVPCCFKRIDGLQLLSYVGVVSVWYLIAVIVIEMDSGSYVQGDIIVWDINLNIFQVLPTICFGYQCHVSSVPIYACLKKKDFGNFMKACSLSIFVCMVVYTVGANSGYMTFGSNVKGDILLSYDAKKPHVMVALLLLAVKSWTTYPILLYCVREAVSDIYLQWSGSSMAEAERLEPRRRVTIAMILWFATIVLAIFTPSIDIVVKLLGSLASSFILIFPGMCWLKRTMDNIDVKGFTTGQLSRLLVAILYILLGVSTFGLAFTLGIENVMNPSTTFSLCITNHTVLWSPQYSQHLLF